MHAAPVVAPPYDLVGEVLPNGWKVVRRRDKAPVTLVVTSRSGMTANPEMGRQTRS